VKFSTTGEKMQDSHNLLSSYLLIIYRPVIVILPCDVERRCAFAQALLSQG
jgi:hypothetical protein